MLLQEISSSQLEVGNLRCALPPPFFKATGLQGWKMPPKELPSTKKQYWERWPCFSTQQVCMELQLGQYDTEGLVWS